MEGLKPALEAALTSTTTVYAPCSLIVVDVKVVLKLAVGVIKGLASRKVRIFTSFVDRVQNSLPRKEGSAVVFCFLVNEKNGGYYSNRRI